MNKRNGSTHDPLTRRHVLTGLGAALGASAFGCSTPEGAMLLGNAPPIAGSAGSADETDGAGGAGGSEGAVGSEGTVGSGRPEGGEAGGAPDRCAETGGLSPAELLAPINTIVVLCMENRSFDHYLGSLLLKEGRQIDGLTGTESNRALDGTRISPFQLDNFTPADPPHSWDAAHTQWNQGMNDGFVIAHAGPYQRDVMGYHVREHLPVLYALADASTICERWFSSVLGPTWPNRFYLHGATSRGVSRNVPVTGFTSVFELLSDAGISSRNYFHDVPWCSGAYFKFKGVSGIERFFEDAAAGLLPSFSVIDPQFFGATANDDHPDHDVQLGQVLIASIYNALAKSPQWGQCLLVITYDEHGGFFDHVAPPTTTDADPLFTQLGFRVPSIVAGPFVRRGCAVSTVLDHASVIRTLEARFDLPALNARSAGANDLSCCIDPALLRDPQEPIVLPEMDISLSRLRSRTESGISQPELWEAAERGLIPRHLDRRGEGPAITRRVLAHAERLGTARLRD
ncbi:alkaline phosphatase family protein [Sorangium sp. So ce448]|uniref:alkaline phosphatase family protein n=1 Tax=Sorangium sp. So ce448 TaxID=3133314 RepID=UPI003F627073